MRNGIVEIRRLSEPGRWFHIDTELNIADLGTRPCNVEDVGLAEWAHLDEERGKRNAAEESE